MSEDPSPKKKRLLIVLAVSIVFAAGALSTLLLIYEPPSTAVSIRQNIHGLPLSEVRAVLEDRSGVENATAALGRFRLVAADDGSLELLYMEFYGDDEDGQHLWCRVRVSPVGVVTLDSQTIDKVAAGDHPLLLLSEIERIPYRELIGENVGVIVDVDANAGDLGYYARYRPLFALHQGEVSPLERVVFSTDEPIYNIALFCRRGSVSDGYTTEETTHCCMLFTLHDLAKAEIVENRSAEAA